MSRKDWQSIGKKAGWMKQAAPPTAISKLTPEENQAITQLKARLGRVFGEALGEELNLGNQIHKAVILSILSTMSNMTKPVVDKISRAISNGNEVQQRQALMTIKTWLFKFASPESEDKLRMMFQRSNVRDIIATVLAGLADENWATLSAIFKKLPTEGVEEVTPAPASAPAPGAPAPTPAPAQSSGTGGTPTAA